mgnify:CR=1 FL=1
MLFGFGCSKNFCQCVAEVHSTDFLSLGRSDFRLTLERVMTVNQGRNLLCQDDVRKVE